VNSVTGNRLETCQLGLACEALVEWHWIHGHACTRHFSALKNNLYHRLCQANEPPKFLHLSFWRQNDQAKCASPLLGTAGKPDHLELLAKMKTFVVAQRAKKAETTPAVMYANPDAWRRCLPNSVYEDAL
jgi:hypothetical protein